MLFRCIVALVALMAFATRAHAEDAKNTRPAFENLRYAEDWSVLQRDVEPKGPLDPIKYIPFDEDGGDAVLGEF